MTIRTRLSLWYATIMFVSLLAMGVMTYLQFAPEPHPNPNPRKLEADKEDFREGVRNIFWCGVPAVLLALAGGWWLMRKALAPVAALTEAADHINERNLGERLPRSGNGDELDRLTEVFNRMLARLDGSFSRVREFTLHASHELKTPLTVLHSELETALLGGALPAVQRERLLSELDEVQRLTKIVDGLTLLTRADAGLLRLVNEPVPFDELVRDNFADAQILARASGVEVQLTACEPVSVRGDRHRLRQLLLNLADNAVKYNQPQGQVTLAVRRAGNFAEFIISNTGAGIPRESLTRVFDRFYRGDAAHSDLIEGSGLGLSIAQWIVSAHDGTIHIQSLPMKQTTVTVRLPLLRE